MRYEAFTPLITLNAGMLQPCFPYIAIALPRPLMLLLRGGRHGRQHCCRTKTTSYSETSPNNTRAVLQTRGIFDYLQVSTLDGTNRSTEVSFAFISHAKSTGISLINCRKIFLLIPLPASDILLPTMTRKQQRV